MGVGKVMWFQRDNIKDDSFFKVVGFTDMSLNIYLDVRLKKGFKSYHENEIAGFPRKVVWRVVNVFY